MSNLLRHRLALGLLLFTAQANVAVAAAEGVLDHCITEWSEAAPIVLREALTPVRDLHIEARRRNLGDIVRVTLCNNKSRYVYRLLVREPSGRVVPLVVNAIRPFAP